MTKWTSKVHEITIKKHWHLLYICYQHNGYWTRKPMMSIQRYSFDFLWMGFQITWRYFGNYIVSGSNKKVKEYDKYPFHLEDQK